MQYFKAGIRGKTHIFKAGYFGKRAGAAENFGGNAAHM